MNTKEQVPVFHDNFTVAMLVKAFLESDGIAVEMVPDVHSQPLLHPGAHDVKSQYTLHILFVSAQDEDRARELIEDFNSQS